MRRMSLALLLIGCIHAADLDNNMITVTASRQIVVQPDQVSIFLEMRTPLETGLDDVLGKLKSLEITPADLSNLYRYGTRSRWVFSISSPLSSLKATMAKLTQLAQSLGTLDRDDVLTFSVAGSQVSAEARAAQPCPLPALVSDARREADVLAAAAGMRAGAIVSVSDQAPAAAPLAVSQFVVLYDPVTSFLPSLTGSLFVAGGASQSACALTVQFKLL